MATNAQAALQAAATHYSSIHNAGEDAVLDCASRFKEWLDEQDTADRKARHAKNVTPKKDREPAQGGIVGHLVQSGSEPPTIPGMIPQMAPPYPSVRSTDYPRVRYQDPGYPGVQVRQGEQL